MFEEYRDKTLLSEFAELKEFNNQKLDFVQIAARYSNFDTGWILGSKDSQKYATEHAITDMVRSLVLGERNYLIKRIETLSEEDRLHSESMPNFNLDRLRGVVSSFNQVTDVFVPWENSHEVIEYSVKNDIKEGDVNGRHYYIFPEFNLWVVGNNSDLGEIVVLNRNKLSVVQKTKRKMRKLVDDDKTTEPIDELKISRELGLDENLMLYFGDSEEKGSIDFLFRSVIALKQPPKKDAGVIHY